MAGTFAGKVAIVNGGTRGLGEAIARQLAQHGARVVITGRTEAQGEAVVGRIQEAGGEALFVKTDCTVEAEIVKAQEAVVAKFGGFDLAVNNLGLEDNPPAPLKDSTEEMFDRCVNNKAKSAFLGMKHQIRHFTEGNKAGAIVNVSSMIGLGGHPNVPAYSAANGAVQALTKSAAVEVARDNIRINCICPGAIADSPMLYRFLGGSDGSAGGEPKPGAAHGTYMEMQAPKYPMGRIADPDEHAKAALFLLSDAASWITGHNLPLDGGYTMSLRP